MTQLAIVPAAAPAPAGAAPAPTTDGPLVIGLDLALQSTGIAGPGWSDHIIDRQRRGEERLDYLLARLQTFYRHADFVTVEGPSFGSALQNGHDEMAALRWFVRRDLWKRQIPFAVIPPDSRAVFAVGTARPKNPDTGNRLTGRALKACVREAAAATYGVEFEGPAKNDRADAYVLMAMGRHHLGHPLADLPDTHTRALAGVAWPERTDQ